jgi:asparaginyl-tRNA synthetase
MMNVPYQSLIVASNEVFKKVLRRKKIELNFATYFGCASLAGLIASCFTMPLDNVRTKMNTQCDLIPQPACPDKIECQCTKQRQGAIKYRNSWTTTTYIWRQEGLRGFFKGLIPRATTQSLSSAVSWTTYELIKAKFLSSNALRKH